MNSSQKTITILIITCLSLIGFNFFTYFTLKQKIDLEISSLAKSSAYPLLDFSRNFKDQKDFLVNLRPLRTDLTNLVSETEDFNMSIYIEFLNTGANIAINPDLRIFPASLTKIPVAMIMMKKVEETEINLDTKFEILEGDLDSGWGELYKIPAGSKLPLEELIALSLKQSDNTAHNVLYRNITPADVSLLEEDLGLSYFFDKEGKVTSREYTRIFRALYTSSFLKKDSSQYLLNLLTTTSFKDYLSSGIPKETIFAHKFGEKKSEGIFLDSGIVYEPNRPYLITVLLEAKNNSSSETEIKNTRNKAINLMQKISSTTYNYLSSKTP